MCLIVGTGGPYFSTYPMPHSGHQRSEAKADPFDLESRRVSWVGFKLSNLETGLTTLLRDSQRFFTAVITGRPAPNRER